MITPIRILLVEILTPVHGLSLPTGLCYLSSYLKEKSQIPVNVEIRSIYPDDWRSITEWEPDIVGISAFTHTFPAATKLAEQIRTACPKTTVVLGGQHITMAPWSLPQIFDFGVIGEGEVVLSRLVEWVYSRNSNKHDLPGVCFYENGNLIETTRPPLIEDLDTIPFPDRDAISYLEKSIQVPHDYYFGGGKTSKRYMQVTTSRGCPYQCQFCQPRKMWGKFRLHSAEYTANEIEFIHRKYGINAVLIEDDLFTGSKKRIQTLVSLLEQKNILGKVQYYVAARACQIDEEWVDLFKKLGVACVELGIESGSDRVAAYLKVDKATREININAISLLNNAEIPIYGSFIIGAPIETREDLHQTKTLIKWIIRNNPRNNIGVNIATPLPGTGLWDHAVAKKLIDQDSINWNQLTTLSSAPSPETLIHINEQMSSKEIIATWKQLNFLIHWYRSPKHAIHYALSPLKSFLKACVITPIQSLRSRRSSK